MTAEFCPLLEVFSITSKLSNDAVNGLDKMTTQMNREVRERQKEQL